MSTHPPPLTRGPVRFLPVLHGHFEFALEVRRAVAAKTPDAIAVEYPATLDEPVRRAVACLPNLTVVLYPESDETYVYLPIEPQDALVEAVRIGLERGIEVKLIDRDVEGYGLRREPFPDPHAIRVLGYVAYVLPLVERAAALPRSPQDDAREQAMAAHLQALAAGHDDILCVLGIAHAQRVMELFAGTALPRVFGRSRRDGARAANLAEVSSREVLSESGYIAAAYEMARGTARPAPAPTSGGASVGGNEVLSFDRAVRSRPRKDRVSREPPAVAALDRNRLNLDLIKAAARRYLAQGVGRLTPLELRNLFRFTRNWAVLNGRLLPRLYELVLGARAVADDNFAYEVWDLGTAYPWQEPDSNLSMVELKAEHLLLDGKLVRFRRKQGERKRMPMPVRKRPQWRPQEWKENWRGSSICSFPPEDVRVEGYGSYLQKKAVAALAEEGARVEPFATSLRDGIDMRETIRNWHREQRLYVRESHPVRGKVGAVVVVFDPDQQAPGEPSGEERYPWKLTWLGEHEQESDMAFYATPPGEKLVGPGISRCEYGGFMMTFPPRRVFDIWEDPFFQGVTAKSERLLLAGIVYALERMVVYVAARAPEPRLRAIAARFDKKLVYLPIGQFSPPMLRRIRVFHVLDSQRVRKHAPLYIR